MRGEQWIKNTKVFETILQAFDEREVFEPIVIGDDVEEKINKLKVQMSESVLEEFDELLSEIFELYRKEEIELIDFVINFVSVLYRG